MYQRDFSRYIVAVVIFSAFFTINKINLQIMKQKNISNYVLNAFLRKVNAFGEENKTDIFTIDELKEIAEEVERTLKVNVKKKKAITGDYNYNRYEQNH